MKKLALLFFLLLKITNLQAQYYTNQNKVWAFGNHAGVSFVSGTPFAISTNISTNEGSASVCDAAGRLLFYTDGKYVYNGYHALMPNGNSIVPFSTSSTYNTSHWKC